MVGVLKDWMDSNSRNGVDYKFFGKILISEIHLARPFPGKFG